MAEVGLGSKLGWELGETVARIHFDTVVSATTGVGGLEGSVVSWAVEGDELVETVAHALEGTTCSVNNPVGPANLAAFGVGLADDLLGNLNHAIKNVAEGAAEFAGGGVLSSWRGLNVCLCRHCKAKCECDQ